MALCMACQAQSTCKFLYINRFLVSDKHSFMGVEKDTAILLCMLCASRQCMFRIRLVQFMTNNSGAITYNFIENIP